MTTDQTGAFSHLTIGVLALQGAFVEHVQMLRRLGAAARD